MGEHCETHCKTKKRGHVSWLGVCAAETIFTRFVDSNPIDFLNFAFTIILSREIMQLQAVNQRKTKN